MLLKKAFHIIAILCVVQLQTSRGWEFPLQQVSLPQCKIYTWDEMPANCKTPLPVLRPSSYTSQGILSSARLTYSVLRGASYEQPWNIAQGGHPGIDLPTAKGTPVYSIGAGKVVKALSLSGFGNSITVEHIDGSRKIYAVYNHLDKMFVKAGDFVQEGQLLGTVGKSGNSITDNEQGGNHLEFQITTSDKLKGPYGYGDCPGGYLSHVNNGSCRDKLQAASIDPLVFFEEKKVSSSLTFQELQKKIETIIVTGPVKAVANTNGSSALLFSTLGTNSNKTVSPKPTVAIQQFFHAVASASVPQKSSEVKPVTTSIPLIQPVRQPVTQPTNTTPTTQNTPQSTDGRTTTHDGNYSFRLHLSTIYLDKGDAITAELLIRDKNGKPVNGVLSSPLQISSEANLTTVFPSSVSFVQEGKKVLRISGIKAGKEKITVHYSLQEVASGTVVISP